VIEDRAGVALDVDQLDRAAAGADPADEVKARGVLAARPVERVDLVSGHLQPGDDLHLRAEPLDEVARAVDGDTERGAVVDEDETVDEVRKPRDHPQVEAAAHGQQ